MTLNKIDKQLKNLNNQLKNLNSTEQLNLYYDLLAMNERIEKGSYKETDFINRNTYNVAQRTKEFFIYLNSYYQIAKTWESILCTFPLSTYQKITHLCPGWAPKVEMAFCFLNYSGTINIIEANNDAAKHLIESIKLFSPKFAIKNSSTDFYSPNLGKSDLVIANHIIDDLLIDEYLKQNQKQSIEIYESEDRFKQVSLEIYNNLKNNYENFVYTFSTQMDKYTKNKGWSYPEKMECF